MVLKPCLKDYVQSADRTLAGPAALEGTGRILLIKLSAGGAALPQHNAPAVSISEYQNRSYRNIYEPLIYKMEPEAAILKSYTNTDFSGLGP